MGSAPAMTTLKWYNIEQSAGTWVKQDYRLTSSVSKMMNDLLWSTLRECRKYSRSIIFYMKTHQISVFSKNREPRVYIQLHSVSYSNQ